MYTNETCYGNTIFKVVSEEMTGKIVEILSAVHPGEIRSAMYPFWDSTHGQLKKNRDRLYVFGMYHLTEMVVWDSAKGV
jgi:hypothetical protein